MQEMVEAHEVRIGRVEEHYSDLKSDVSALSQKVDDAFSRICSTLDEVHDDVKAFSPRLGSLEQSRKTAKSWAWKIALPLGALVLGGAGGVSFPSLLKILGLLGG